MLGLVGCGDDVDIGLPDASVVQHDGGSIDEDSGWVDEDSGWVDDTSVPAIDTSLLAIDTSLPAVDTSVPAVDTSVPAVDTSVPAVDTSLPAVDTSVPAVDTSLPAVDTSLPAVDAGIVPPVNAFKCVIDPNVACDEQRVFYEIALSMPATKKTWGSRYDLSLWPQYIIHVDNSVKGDRGYLINPHKSFAGVVVVPPDVAQGLKNLYRWDDKLIEAVTTVVAGNGLYDNEYDLAKDGTKYNAQIYTDADLGSIAAGEPTWVNVLVHETFHSYQSQPPWAEVLGSVQDWANYPKDANLYGLHFLGLAILEDAWKNAKTKTEKETSLKMFLAARMEAINTDISPKKLVKNMFNFQEQMEGSADYIEIWVRESFSVGWADKHYGLAFTVVQDSLNNPVPFVQDVGENVFGYTWYKSGSILLWLFDQLGVQYLDEIEKNGKTNYDIAIAAYPIGAAEQVQLLAAAKTKFDWTKIFTATTTMAN